MTINISVINKRAVVVGNPIITCGNSDYKVQFTFDDEWNGLSPKKARFGYIQDGAVRHEDVEFTGDTVDVPVLVNVRRVLVGVYAGELHTTTPATIPCDLSILCVTSAPGEPTPTQYEALLKMMGDMRTDIDNLKVGVDKEAIAEAVEEYLTENPPDGSVTVDSELSETSENPVQNKVAKAELDKKLSKTGHTPNMYLGTTEHGDVVTRPAPKLYMSPATGGTKITLETFEGVSEVIVRHVSVDSFLYEESENPVQNKVLTRKINELSGQISDLKQNGTGGTGWTTAQINLLDEIGNFIPFTSAEGGMLWDNLINSLKGNSSGEEPDNPDEPDTPVVTLTSISATYTGGEVATGTALTDLTGITVTAHYSDGTTKTVTGYTLNGEILEGENTITVSYSGKTTTFAVTGIVESGGGDAELPTDGLVDYFDFRTCDYNNEGAGNTTLIQPTQGNGQLYTWAKNAVTEQSSDYGIKVSRSHMYSTGKTTDQASCGNAFTWVFKSYLPTFESPLFSEDHAIASNVHKLSYAPKYNKTDNSTVKISAEGLGTKNSGYDLIFFVVDGNICR